MDTDLLSGSGLQSGFVVAVIIAAVFLANHLGGGKGLARKAAQVALGLALMMLVFSGTTAFHGAPDIPVGQLDSMFNSEMELVEATNDAAVRNSEVGSIHIGLGIIFVVLGVVVFRKMGALTPGLLLGGILLLLLGAPGDVGDQGTALGALGGFLTGILPGTFSDAGTAREIVRFAVLAVGTLLLAGVLCCWDRRHPAASTDAPTDEEESQDS